MDAKVYKRVFGLVIDFGTSQSPKSTRPLTTYWCPSRPGHQALRNNFASSLLLRTWLPMTGRRVRRPTLFSLWRKARRENSAASRLLGSTSLRFALHGWQRVKLNKEAGSDPLSLFGSTTMALLSLLCAAIPGVGFSLLLMLIAFARGNRILLYTGMAALLYHLSRYYYVLDLSLLFLYKSTLLLGCGLLLLGLRWWLLRTSAEAGQTS